jgi:hypothetical protein
MVAGYRELLEMKIRLIGEARFEPTTSNSSTAPLLTSVTEPTSWSRTMYTKSKNALSGVAYGTKDLFPLS